jgi:hypothetical protein
MLKYGQCEFRVEVVKMSKESNICVEIFGKGRENHLKKSANAKYWLSELKIQFFTRKFLGDNT